MVPTRSQTQPKHPEKPPDPTAGGEPAAPYRSPSEAGMKQLGLGAGALVSVLSVLLYYGPRIAALVSEIMDSLSQPEPTSDQQRPS